jgi:hypothetical protein
VKERWSGVLKRLALAVVVLACAYGAAMLWGSLRLRAAYRDLEAAGRPMLASELIPKKVSDPENAALLYQAAALCLKAQPAGEEGQNALLEIRTLTSEEPVSNAVERATQLDQLLATDAVRRAVELVAEGAKRPHCRYELDYARGAEMVVPHFSDLWGLTAAVCGYAWRQAEIGDSDGAWKTTLAAVLLADALRHEPLIDSQLVRMKQAGIVCGHIQRMADAVTPDAKDAAAISEALTAFEAREPFVRGLDGERIFSGEWVYGQSAADVTTLMSSGGCLHHASFTPRAVMVVAGCISMPALKVGHAEYLRAMQAYAECAEEGASIAEDDFCDRLIEGLPWYALNARVLVPAHSTVGRRQVEMESVARVTRVGLQVLRIRATGGTWPVSLEAAGVAEADRRDPFTGGDLVYKVEGGGFVLYSLGPDQRDDGGTPRKEYDDSGYDIVWRHSL